MLESAEGSDDQQPNIASNWEPMKPTIGCRGGKRNGMGWGGVGPHGSGNPWEPKRIPWEGTHGSGNHWESKGSHGRGPGPAMGGEPLGAQGIPWEGTLGAPIGSPLSVRGPFWRHSVMK